MAKNEEEFTTIANFPANWVKEKFFSRDPDDDGDYPEVMYSVDPAEFSLPPRKQGYDNWGLPNVKVQKTAGYDQLRSVGDGALKNLDTEMLDTIQLISYKAKIWNMYVNKQSPFEQYLDAVIKKKMQSVTSPEVQEACKTTLRITGIACSSFVILKLHMVLFFSHSCCSSLTCTCYFSNSNSSAAG